MVPPRALTRSRAAPRSSTVKYGSENESPGPRPRAWTPTWGAPRAVCHPSPSGSRRGTSSASSRPDQNCRARSGSSAGNSIREGLIGVMTCNPTDRAVPDLRADRLTHRRIAQSIAKALPPAVVSGREAKLRSGLGVGGAANLGHQRDADRLGQVGQPGGYRCRLIVDDVEDAALAMIKCGNRHGGGIIDMDKGPHAGTGADDRKPALGDQIQKRAAVLDTGSRPIEVAAAQHNPLDVRGRRQQLL